MVFPLIRCIEKKKLLCSVWNNNPTSLPDSKHCCCQATVLVSTMMLSGVWIKDLLDVVSHLSGRISKNFAWPVSSRHKRGTHVTFRWGCKYMVLFTVRCDQYGNYQSFYLLSFCLTNKTDLPYWLTLLYVYWDIVREEFQKHSNRGRHSSYNYFGSKLK